MEKRTKIYALILLALCLAVVPVMATDYSYSLHFGQSQTINLGNIYDTDTITVTGFAYYSNSPDFEVYNAGVIINSETVYGGPSPSNSYNVPIRAEIGNSTAATQQSMINIMNNQPMVRYGDITFNYNVVSSQPTAPYITATVYNTGENNLYYDYNVRCMPAEGYFFAPLSFYSYGGQLPQCDLTSEETSIQVRVWAGDDIPIYSCALSGSGGVPNFQYIQTVLSAPVYTAGEVVNNQTVHEELDNLPNPVKPSGSSGGIVSGAWQPLAVKQNLTVINTPFSYIVDNYLHYFHFPEMATPETVKSELLNGTGNLTAPLYDSIDGLTSVFMIIPNYVSGVLTGLISPISETVLLVKDIIYTLCDYVYNAMSVLYVFVPFIYLFIPDVIWWGLTIYLSYLVFAWLLTLLFGYDVISVFYIDPFVSWVRSRKGGE